MTNPRYLNINLSPNQSAPSKGPLAWLTGIAGIASLVLFADLWLQDGDASSGLCATAGCQLAGQSLRMGEIPLLVLGIIFFALLSVLAYFYLHRGSRWMGNLLNILICGGLAFDSALLGYQFLVLQAMCQICIGVGAALGLIFFLQTAACKKAVLILMGMAIWLGGFSAMAVLDLTPPTPDFSTAIQFKTGNSTADGPTYHLFYSNYCDQCESVLTILAATNPQYVSWTISCADTDTASLSRLAGVWNTRNATSNIFAALLSAKKAALSSIPIPSDLRQSARNVRTYLINKGYTGVPLIIATQGKHQKTIVEGKFFLLDYLREQGVLDSDNPLVKLLGM